MASSADTSPRSLHFSQSNTQLPSFDSFLRSAGQQGPTLPPPIDTTRHDIDNPPVSPYGTRFTTAEPARQSHQHTGQHTGDERSESFSFGFWPPAAVASSTNSIDRAQYGSAPPQPGTLQPPFNPNNLHGRGSISTPLATLDISQAQSKYVVREEHVPGKGHCFVYDDGTHCQTSINGEAVNPKWGTTKQGKPRKRLGQACNTCREKKIKCDPSIPKCAQCQKFNRECKFETTSRSQVKSPQSQSSANSPAQATANDDQPEWRRESSSSVDATHPPPLQSGRSSKSSMSLENVLTPFTSADSTAVEDYEYRQVVKRRRTSAAPDSAGSESHGFSIGDVTVRAISSRGSNNELTFRVDIDPYEVDPSLTVSLLSQYFAHLNDVYAYMLPRRAFIKWLKTRGYKTRSDIMLLYALMALGSVFTKRLGQEQQREMFERFALEGLAECKEVNSLQAIQTKFVLANLDFVQGDGRKGWDLLAAATHDSCVMEFNTEDGVRHLVDGQRNEYDLPSDMLFESRRRTFWSIYVVVCFSSICISFAGLVHKSDCLLRLPCTEADFESGTIPETPFFLHSWSSSNNNNASDPSAKLGTQAYLVQIASMTSDIMSNVKRMSIYPKDDIGPDFEGFRQQMKTRLQVYNKALREMYLASSLPHTTKSKSNRFEGVGGLHIFYHYACMLLHRYVRHARISPELAEQYVYDAYRHAGDMLETLQQLHNHTNRLSSQAKFMLFAPVIAPSILGAIDTITAAGSVSALLETGSRSMELVTAAIEMLDTLSEHWQMAKCHRELVKERLQSILQTHNPDGTRKKTGFYFKKPMLDPFGADDDIVYGLPRMQYLRALGWGERVSGEADLYEIRAT